jgi:NAD(P)-dependent dehydrogenase (short-subunit alcohol dehydrogenase family)
MRGRFHGRVAVVTGAASGIGAATARRLAADGARVLLVDLDAAAVERCSHELAGEAAGFAADVSEEGDVAAYTDAALEMFGRIDLVFLNAGIPGPMIAIADLEASDFDRVVSVNLRGVFLGLRAGLRELRTGGGSIVVTASTAGVSGSDLGAYSAAKHGVVGLVKSAALEGAAHRIRVNAIAPGSIETPMTDALIDRLGDRDDARESLWSTTPLGREQRRFGSSDEVASLVGFLLSDEAAWITGAVVPVDGGVLASDPYRLPDGDVTGMATPGAAA